ncbi:lysozyme 2-like [Pectinophora gossypiella]|uniref:lysozyme 2-like n=1 Tax=Pectinophora gossypiella TaxID=13191 RepID=UPI00214E906D|nr:lysozyme 2-like [Pectinophora gossypiella]
MFGLRVVSFLMCLTSVFGIYISNLNESCIRCLCHISGCDTGHGCSEGYCGPFYISRVYWADAGKPTLPEDDPNREKSFEDCARNYHCSIKIVTSYLAKFGKDCNYDGVTDCYDYMMINHNGGGACHAPLQQTELGRARLELFQQCRF